MNNITLSVIIPTYNQALYIGAAIDSVLKQIPDYCEVIVVDDGSTDDTQEILNNYHDKIIILQQKNSGIGAARNAGINIAKGKYIGFLDSDDLWSDDHYQSLMDVFKSNPKASLVYGMTEEFIEASEDKNYLLRQSTAGFLCGSIFVTKQFIEQVGLFRADLIMGEFIEWISRARALKLIEVGINQLVLKRRIHGKNTTIKQAQNISDYYKILREKLSNKNNQASYV